MINSQSIFESRKKLDELNIPLIYQTFPQDFHMHINGWSFPDDKEKATIYVDLTHEEVEN
ncbi:MAG: hypothetical protein M0T74_14450 [Desulfitobacterium hafniense]|nr:hypothetical protein [Desulfitobacterium hafniense]